MQNQLSEALKTYDKRKNNKRKDFHLEGFEQIFDKAFKSEYNLMQKDKPVKESDYRTKRWDYSLYKDNRLSAVIELKTLDKSAKKNINNRMEEAEGCASFIKRTLPHIKTGYLIIGDNLDELTRTKWKSFLYDLQEAGKYDGVCCIFINEDRTYVTPFGLGLEDLISKLKQEK